MSTTSMRPNDANYFAYCPLLFAECNKPWCEVIHPAYPHSTPTEAPLPSGSKQKRTVTVATDRTAPRRAYHPRKGNYHGCNACGEKVHRSTAVHGAAAPCNPSQ